MKNQVFKSIHGGLVTFIGLVMVALAIATTTGCAELFGSPEEQPRISFVESVRDQTYSVGVVVQLTLPYATANGTVEYTLEPEVPGMSFDPTTRVYSGSPRTIGVHSMKYTARSPADGGSESLTFMIRVVEIGKTKETATEIMQGAPIRGRFTGTDEIHYFKVDVPFTVDLYAATDRNLSGYRTIVEIETVVLDDGQGYDYFDADHIDAVENAPPGIYYITVKQRSADSFFWIC